MSYARLTGPNHLLLISKIDGVKPGPKCSSVIYDEPAEFNFFLLYASAYNLRIFVRKISLY